jgi:hypothetical protein
MKKIIIIFTVVASMLFALTGCSAAASTAGTQSQAASTTIPAVSASGLLPENELMTGTIRLEGSEAQVDAQQAAALLLLWQAYSTLSSSDTTAQEELDALFTQIQGTMTAVQIQSITDMQLAQPDVMAVIQESGLAMNASSGSDSSAPAIDLSAGGGPSSGPPAGGVMMGGGPPDMTGDGVRPDNMENLTPDQIATAQAGGRMSASDSTISPMLLQAVIQYLQSKIQ